MGKDKNDFNQLKRMIWQPHCTSIKMKWLSSWVICPQKQGQFHFRSWGEMAMKNKNVWGFQGKGPWGPAQGIQQTFQFRHKWNSLNILLTPPPPFSFFGPHTFYFQSAPLRILNGLVLIRRSYIRWYWQSAWMNGLPTVQVFSMILWEDNNSQSFTCQSVGFIQMRNDRQTVALKLKLQHILMT